MSFTNPDISFKDIIPTNNDTLGVTITEPLPSTVTQACIQVPSNIQLLNTSRVSTQVPATTAPPTIVCTSPPTGTELEEEIKITKPLTKPPLIIRKGKINRKEGKLLAKTNTSMRSWLVKSTRKSVNLSSIQEEEDNSVSMMEVDDEMDIGICAGNYRRCRWGAERRVKRVHTRE